MDFVKSLVDFYADAWKGAAREVGLLSLDEGDDAISGGVNGEIARHIGAFASNLSGTSLADENFSVLDGLATKTLDTETLTCIIMDILGGTACFDV